MVRVVAVEDLLVLVLRLTLYACESFVVGVVGVVDGGGGFAHVYAHEGAN